MRWVVFHKRVPDGLCAIGEHTVHRRLAQDPLQASHDLLSTAIPQPVAFFAVFRAFHNPYY